MKEIKEPSTRQFWFAVILVVFGCALLVAGFVVSPTGEIHSSVLAAFGEIMTFAGAVLGFDYYNRKTYLTIARRHDIRHPADPHDTTDDGPGPGHYDQEEFQIHDLDEKP